jgi:membrane associated rhomboid family serine protease
MGSLGRRGVAVSEAKKELKSIVMVLAWFVGAFWFIEIVDYLFVQPSDFNPGDPRHQKCPLLEGAGSLDFCGIRPGSTSGLLLGIPMAPFLHGGLDHLVGNSVPFVVLGFLTLLRGQAIFFGATVMIAVVAGVGTWLFGADNSYHIGASGLIFGYFGFLVMAGVFERSLKSILVALAVGFGYGGIIWGVLPGTPGISWEGHLFGLIGGAISAFYLTRTKSKTMGSSRPR